MARVAAPQRLDQIVQHDETVAAAGVDDLPPEPASRA